MKACTYFPVNCIGYNPEEGCRPDLSLNILGCTDKMNVSLKRTFHPVLFLSNSTTKQLFLLQFHSTCIQASTLQQTETHTRGKSSICHLPGNRWVLTNSGLVLKADAVVSQDFKHMLVIENSLQILPQGLDGKEQVGKN